MADEIEKFTAVERAVNGNKVRSSRAQVIAILHPMFVIFEKKDEAVLEQYVSRLQDIDADVLRVAVNKAIEACKFFPRIADIREQIETRPPGPRSEGTQAQRRPVPQKMYRLPEEDDKAARMAQLRRTAGWRYA